MSYRFMRVLVMFDYLQKRLIKEETIENLENH